MHGDQLFFPLGGLTPPKGVFSFRQKRSYPINIASEQIFQTRVKNGFSRPHLWYRLIFDISEHDKSAKTLFHKFD